MRGDGITHLRRLGQALLAAAVLALAYQSVERPDFWRTATQRGDRLLAEKKYAEATNAYQDPWRIGAAQYRNGDFEAAVAAFARVPGATGAFNQGNALLMLGKYDRAIAAYDRALGFKPGWQAAQDNRALAAVRKQRIDDAGNNRDRESTDTFTPDEIVFDQQGDDEKSRPVDLNGQEMSDAELRATWLRRVQTTPGDFLRAKFAYQAAHAESPDAAPAAKERQ